MTAPVRDQWTEAQEGEAAWWGDCVNTYQEETKQRTIFAPRLGLVDVWDTSPHARGRWPVYDLAGQSVIDIGGGPVSLLLKCVQVGAGSVVLDPCPYPLWVWDRYEAYGLQTWQIRGEDIVQGQLKTWDEAWLYNVLQHVVDPERVIANAKSVAMSVRVVEWVNIGIDELHAHNLNGTDLNRWLGITTGREEWIPECGAAVYTGWWDA